MMTLNDLDDMHRDPANWRLVFFYFCPADPRIVVKKRFSNLGWTLNFARPATIPLIIVVTASVYGIMRLNDHLQWGNTGYWLSVLAILVGIFSLFGWLSNPQRYRKCRENRGGSVE